MQSGIIAVTAFGTAILYATSRGSKLSTRKVQRPVLITFLIASALWALTYFFAIAADFSDSQGCQVAVVFASFFDQVARPCLEQALLWLISDVATTSVLGLCIQAEIALRTLIGFILVGFQRPSHQPMCTSQNDLLPLGVVLVVLDGFVLLTLSWRAGRLGLFTKKEGRTASLAVAAVAWTMVSDQSQGCSRWSLIIGNR